MSRTGARDESHGALKRGSSATWVRPGPGRPPPQLAHARASSFLCLASTNRTAAHLIEPPSPARHSGPPSATEWMTGALPTAPAAASGPAPNHPRPLTSALTRARPFMDDIGAAKAGARRRAPSWIVVAGDP